MSNINNCNSLKVVRKQNQTSTVTATTSSSKDSESKKREDLTSLGSDDSGEKKKIWDENSDKTF